MLLPDRTPPYFRPKTTQKGPRQVSLTNLQNRTRGERKTRLLTPLLLAKQTVQRRTPAWSSPVMVVAVVAGGPTGAAVTFAFVEDAGLPCLACSSTCARATSENREGFFKNSSVWKKNAVTEGTGRCGGGREEEGGESTEGVRGTGERAANALPQGHEAAELAPVIMHSLG